MGVDMSSRWDTDEVNYNEMSENDGDASPEEVRRIEATHSISLTKLGPAST